MWDYNLGRDKPQEEEVTPLALDSYSISPAGELFVGFNKPIIIPPIKTNKRQLKKQSYFDINEVIEFSVVTDSAGSDLPVSDSSIVDFDLIELTERYFRI